MARPGLWLTNGSPTNVAQMLGWRPGAVCVFYDYLSANHVAQYRAANPDAPIIIRFQHPMTWRSDVVATARMQADYVLSKWPDIRALNPYVYFCNEMNLHYENGDPSPGNQWQYETQEFYQSYARWVQAVADRIKQQAPDMRLVCPPFAYGHHEDGAPDDDGNPKEEWAGYDYLADTIRTHFDNIICGHYYWGDASGSIPARLYDPVESSWHAFRWRRVLNLFRVRYGMYARMIIDEAGNFGAMDTDFTAQCEYYARQTLADPRVLALTFFLWEDPTSSPGNLPNSWVQRCQNLEAHVAAMGALDVQPIPPPTPTIRVLAAGVIHTLPLEEYLRGVVPAEMPALWDMDALKAQAVWARSYALWRIANPRHASFDVYATTSDQVWNTAMIHTRSDQAVRETAGMAPALAGDAFAARYVSKCGRADCPYCQGANGYNGEVWSGRACQYGARAMAQRGDTWQQISLAYFGEGVMLTDYTEPVLEEPEGGNNPPGGTEPMAYKIYDVLGNEKDAAWLASEWGVEVDVSLRRANSDNFELIELREIENGNAIYTARVQDRTGAPWSGRFVGRYYPSAPNGWTGGSKPDNVPAPPEATSHVVFGTTTSAGVCEFGLGGDDYAGPGDGVSALWLAEHYAGTDCLKKMGMKPNTNHRTISPLFRYVPAGAVTPIPDPIPVPTPDPVPVPTPVPAVGGLLSVLISLLGNTTLLTTSSGQLAVLIVLAIIILAYLKVIPADAVVPALVGTSGVYTVASKYENVGVAAAQAKK